jgi:hypothetical protein
MIQPKKAKTPEQPEQTPVDTVETTTQKAVEAVLS